MSAIQNELLKMAVFYRDEKLTAQHLALYAEVLKDQPLEKVQYCVGEYCKDPANTFFPVPPTKILKYANLQADDESLAVEAASRVVAAVSKFGWAQPAEAQAYVGEVGWHVVDRFGGWLHICQNLGSDISLTTFQAQARDLARSSVKLQKLGRFDQPVALPAPQTRGGGLVAIGSVVRKLTTKPEGE